MRCDVTLYNSPVALGSAFAQLPETFAGGTGEAATSFSADCLAAWRTERCHG